MADHAFGGPWTLQKLACLERYLKAYMRIFSRNPRARRLRTVYVDAFAGTGYRCDPRRTTEDTPMFPEICEEPVQQFLRGSAAIAIELEPAFDRYVLMEKDPDKVMQLREVAASHPGRNIEIHQGDANERLQRLCRNTDWHKHRAVVFVDPYGMELGWSTIEAMAYSHGIDMWLLFPLGVAVNRLLTRTEAPLGAWADRLTRTFGTDLWKDAFYPGRTHETLFGPEQSTSKEADIGTIGAFFHSRLKEVFTAVAPSPLSLKNSRNVTLYLLCFAASNPHKADLAVRIAQDIMDDMGQPVLPKQRPLS